MNYPPPNKLTDNVSCPAGMQYKYVPENKQELNVILRREPMLLIVGSRGTGKTWASQNWIMLHEQIEADRNAMNLYMRMGYTPTEAFNTFSKVAALDKISKERFKTVKEYINEFNAKHTKWTTLPQINLKTR